MFSIQREGGTEGDQPTSDEVYVSFPCADADSHLMETPEWLAAHVAEPARSELHPLDLSVAGATAADDMAALEARPAGQPAPQVRELLEAKAWRAYGAIDPAERSRALDRLGFERQLVFSTLATTQFPRAGFDVTYACVQGLNEAVAAFCARDERLLPVAYVPLEEPDFATRSAERAIELGAAAILMPFSPPPRAPSHPAHDHYWQVLEDGGVPVVFHLGFGSQSIPAAFLDNDLDSTDFLGSERSLRAVDAVVAHHGLETFLSSMVLDGLFDRFPSLRVACMEFGAGWVPDWMRRLDLSLKYGATEPAVRSLERLPSETVCDQFLFCPQPDEELGQLLSSAPPELFMFASDFPHPEGSNDPVGAFRATLGRCSEHDRALFFRENFRRVFESAPKDSA